MRLLEIDHEKVREKDRILIVPYNSPQYLKTRNEYDRILDTWPILVELKNGSIRFAELDELTFWGS